MKKFTKLLLLAVSVATVGLLASACIIVVDTDAEVRYTWESRQQTKIVSIAASYDDVAYWKQEVYNKYSYDSNDATDVPLWTGSHDIPDNIYSQTINSVYYKGRYLPISTGKYTAVCTAEDQYGYIDIVANYNISINGSYRYFELAFNVREILAGEEVSGWDLFKLDNSYDGPFLSKEPTKALVKTIVKENVTYYVLRRPAEK